MLLARLKSLNTLDDRLAAWLARLGSSSSLITALILTAVLAGNVALLVFSPGPALTALVQVGPVVATGFGFVSNGTTWYGWFRVVRRRGTYGVKDFVKDKALDLPGQIQGLPDALHEVPGRLDAEVNTRVTEASRNSGCLRFVSPGLLVVAVIVAAATYAPPPFRLLGAASTQATAAATRTALPTMTALPTETVTPTETALPTGTAAPTATQANPTPTTVPFVTTTFPIPGARPVGVTAGPDGNVWVTEPTSHQIARVTPGGQVTHFSVPRANAFPLFITTGPDNALWYTDYASGMVGRLTLNGQFTEFQLAAKSGPYGIVAGPDGNLWICEAGAGAIARMTPSGAVTEFPLRAATNPRPTLITTGPAIQTPNGPAPALWLTEGGTGSIAAITMSGSVTSFNISAQLSALGGATAQPFGITAGKDGNLWVTAVGVSGVVRVSPAGKPITGFPMPGTGHAPRGIVAGPDGNLWAADSTANALDRITPDGVVTSYPLTTTPEALPTMVAVGSDGNLWVTEQGASALARFTL